MTIRRTMTRTALAAGLVTALALSACSGSSKPVAASHPSAPAAVTPSAAPSPSPTAAAMPVCSISKMTVAVNAAHTGEVSGRENVVFDLRNTATKPCQLDGHPKLVVLRGTGIVDLKFPATSAFSRDVTGSGPIAPGKLGRFTATVAITGCAKTAKRYPKLGIELPGVQLLQMPYPKQLAKSGCPLSVTAIGPVTA
jgi:hypothetical protein